MPVLSTYLDCPFDENCSLDDIQIDKVDMRIRYPRRDPHKDEAFYTKPSTVSIVQAYFDNWMTDKGLCRDRWAFVGPTAGDGALTRGFIDDALLFDRVPNSKFNVRKCEYDQLDIGSLGDNVIILENPPFGQHHAVKFFNYISSPT